MLLTQSTFEKQENYLSCGEHEWLRFVEDILDHVTLLRVPRKKKADP